MLFPIEDIKSWSEKYKILPKEGICLSCKKTIEANKPFADGSLRGFISEDHGCGVAYCLVTFVSLKKSDKDFWNTLAQSVEAPCAKV